MKARLPWFVCLLTAAGLILTSAQQVKYLQLGGKLELDITPVTEDITGVLWKHGPNKVTEWDKGFGPDVDYYGTYKKRTELVKATGKLVVNNTNTDDSGIYSVEVNGRVQSKTYKVEVIKDVPKPNVEVKPLACGPQLANCTLVCGGDVTKSGPVTYRWKKDEGGWMASSDSNQTTIFNNEEGIKAKQFMCEIKNKFSVKQSDLKDNPLYSKESSNGAIGVVVGVGVVLLLIVAAGLGSLFGVKYIEPLNKKVPDSVRNGLPGPLKSWLFPQGPGATDPTTDGSARGEGNGVPLEGATREETAGLIANTDAPTTNSSDSAPATTAVDLAGGSAGREGNGGNPPAPPTDPANG